MYRSLQVAAVILVAVAMALSLAHALELPGKMRLGKDTYLAVQQIYYPGFTIGGGAEPLAILALLVLLGLTPSASARFWWTLAAVLLLVASHLTYWLVTHPVNNFWIKDVEMSGLGARFFALFVPVATEGSADWSRLRDIWEYSHLARAAFAMVGLISLTIAVTA
jgi:hypothetical protein